MGTDCLNSSICALADGPCSGAGCAWPCPRAYQGTGSAGPVHDSAAGCLLCPRHPGSQRLGRRRLSLSKVGERTRAVGELSCTEMWDWVCVQPGRGLVLRQVPGGPPPNTEVLPASRAVLMEKPDVVVGTPSRILNHLQQDSLKLRDSLELLVMDEADLLFSFGFEEELKSLLW